MSVVNKMLNDLEQRGASESPSANYIPPVRQNRRRLWGWTLIIVVCVIAALLMAFVQNKEPDPAEPASTSLQQPVSNASDIAETQHAQRSGSAQASTEPLIVTEPAPAPVQPATSIPRQADVTEVATRAAPDTQVETPPQRKSTQSAAPSLTVNSEKSGSTPNAGLRERIRLALEENQMLSAISLMQALHAREPENVTLSKKLAATLFAEGQIEAARQLLTNSLGANPQQHSLRLMLARLYVQQQQHSVAIQVLEEAEAYAPLSLSLLAFRGELMRDRQRYDRAWTDYAQLAARDPGNARWWLGLAITAEALDKTAEARAAYQQALSLNQLDSDVATYMRARLNALSGGNP